MGVLPIAPARLVSRLVDQGSERFIPIGQDGMSRAYPVDAHNPYLLIRHD